MELISRDGGYLELRPEGYEFDAAPPAQEGEEDDYDEWLVISGRVRIADGREWSFTDPCLTTDEAESLAVWLADVGAGEVALTTSQAKLYFIEPNLAFSLEEATPARARVRVHFSHESMPPWNPHHDWPDYHAFFVPFDVSTADLRTAAQQWRIENQPFPGRTPPRSPQ
ncbi:hypothetical protein [Micromonospora sp. NPDC093277]|uniref:WapI family immunity protein n=1 Tax=Micromonospora sp. NPDC093277 TaxID=3364291 RepID=UPI00380DEC28